MKTRIGLGITIVLGLALTGYSFGPPAPEPGDPTKANIIYLHHSTGGNIWGGGVPDCFSDYNTTNSTNYQITEQAFPKSTDSNPDYYGWNNYPFDYWNIWVNHANVAAYKYEPTLTTLTATYDVIVWKHCFPVSGLSSNESGADVTSEEKTIQNYKLQYTALKAKMHEFSGTKFIVWTGAALTDDANDATSAALAREFFTWVRDVWDEDGDNIFVWDFYSLETEGSLYMKNEHASSYVDEHGVTRYDSHPNGDFSAEVAPYFCRRVIDVIQGNGDSGSVTGKY